MAYRLSLAVATFFLELSIEWQMWYANGVPIQYRLTCRVGNLLGPVIMFRANVFGYKGVVTLSQTATVTSEGFTYTETKHTWMEQRERDPLLPWEQGITSMAFINFGRVVWIPSPSIAEPVPGAVLPLFYSPGCRNCMLLTPILLCVSFRDWSLSPALPQ